MKSALWLAAKFILLTVPLTWLWVEGGREVYGSILKPASSFVHDFFGAERVKPVWRERYINFVPLVSLMLLTPGVPWKRLAWTLPLALAALFVCHIGMNWLSFEIRGRGPFPRFLAVFSDALPFFLWAALNPAFVGELARRVVGPSAPEEPTGDAPGAQ